MYVKEGLMFKKFLFVVVMLSAVDGWGMDECENRIIRPRTVSSPEQLKRKIENYKSKQGSLRLLPDKTELEEYRIIVQKKHQEEKALEKLKKEEEKKAAKDFVNIFLNQIRIQYQPSVLSIFDNYLQSLTDDDFIKLHNDMKASPSFLESLAARSLEWIKSKKSKENEWRGPILVKRLASELYPQIKLSLIDKIN